MMSVTAINKHTFYRIIRISQQHW